MGPPRHPHHRGSLPKALRAVAREILDETSPEDLQLREVRAGSVCQLPRRIDISKTEMGLASIAAEGFNQLPAHLERASADGVPLVRTGLAYVEFALQERGPREPGW